MNVFQSIILSLIVAVIASVATVKFMIPAEENTASAEKKTESTYDRVMRTKTLRCGYAYRPPLFGKSLKTGEFEGVLYDYTEALGEALGLEIEWASEVGWGDVIEYLKTDKIDAFCAGLWAVSHRAPHIDFVTPILYEPVLAYTRYGETKFDHDLSGINDPAVKLVAVEGGAPSLIGIHDFPAAQKVDLPQLTPITDIFLNIVSGKADVALSDIATAEGFMAANPGKIQAVALDRPIRSFGIGLPVKADEYRFKAMLDFATKELLQTGQIEKIIQKYETYPGSLYRVAVPYDMDINAINGDGKEVE